MYYNIIGDSPGMYTFFVSVGHKDNFLISQKEGMFHVFHPGGGPCYAEGSFEKMFVQINSKKAFLFDGSSRPRGEILKSRIGVQSKSQGANLRHADHHPHHEN